MPRLEGCKQRMVDRCAASLAKLESDGVELKAAIDAHVAKTKTTLSAELKARLKALDSQLDGLSVSASQLSAGVALCDRVCSNADAPLSVLTAACDTVAVLRKLCVPYHGPCLPTLCEVTSDCTAVLTALSKSLSQLLLCVDASASVSRRGKRVHVAVKDAYGGLVESACGDDVVAWVESVGDGEGGEGGAGQASVSITSIDGTEQGGTELAIEYAGKSAVVGLNIFGTVTTVTAVSARLLSQCCNAVCCV